MPQSAPGENGKRQRIDEAYRDKGLRCQDECDCPAFGMFGRCPVQDRDCHDKSVAFAIKPARGLDLLHLLARWNFYAERAFNRLDFLSRGLEQIDPDGIGRQGVGCVACCSVDAARQNVGCGHIGDDGARSQSADDVLPEGAVLVEIGGNHTGLLGRDLGIRPGGIGEGGA